MNVGIDLGTTNTVVSYINEFDEWKLLSFSNGNSDDSHMLPSCLSVVEDGVKIGQSALSDRLNNADNFLCDTKYYMGTERRFSRGGITFTAKSTAEKILGEVMSELKQQFPEEKSFNAFVTVPARFLEAARRDTREALINVGFEDNGEKRSLTDEPVAAALAYSSKLTNASTVLVVDYGGGTFDLSLVQTNTVGVSGGMGSLRVKNWGGELHLGGNDVDKLLVNKMLDKFAEDGGRRFDPWSVVHTPEEQRASAIILSLPLEIKKQLYSDFSNSAYVVFPNLLDGVDLDFEISPREYEDMMAEISVRYQNCIKQIFSNTAGESISIASVDKVLIVGGMAHEPCLKKVLLSIFNDESKLVIPKESMYLVSKGAAIWNSNSDLHVENKAYSSIGLLMKNGSDVQNIIKEGSVIDDKGTTFTGRLELSRTDATFFKLTIVEYRGTFEGTPGSYNVIVSRDIPISSKQHRKHGFGIFKKNRSEGINIDIRMNADKLFRIIVKQPGGDETEISLRLNS